MYRITYRQGNGYRCGCCRQSWEGSIDLDTDLEVIDYLANKIYISKNPDEGEYDDEWDWGLEEVREIKDDVLTDKFRELAEDVAENKNTVKARKIKLMKIAKKFKKDLHEDEKC